MYTLWRIRIVRFAEEGEFKSGGQIPVPDGVFNTSPENENCQDKYAKALCSCYYSKWSVHNNRECPEPETWPFGCLFPTSEDHIYYIPQPQPHPELRQITHVYSRRKRNAEILVKAEPVDEDDDDDDEGLLDRKRRQRCSELVKLGVDSTVLSRINRPRLRESRFQYNVTNAE